MNETRKKSSLSYLLQGSFSFSKYNLGSETPNCCCHSNRFGKTLVAFAGADSGSVVICLSDKYLETQFDGGGAEDSQPIEDNEYCCGIVTEFSTEFLCLSSDSILVAIKTDADILVFHSSVFFVRTAESNGSRPLQVYYPNALLCFKIQNLE